MADPLSVAGSIAGLISLADVVFRLVFKYARSAINAKEEVKTLADEIQALAGALQSLRLLAGGLEAEGHSFDPTIRTFHLGTLSSTLSRLHQRVEKAYTKFESGSKTQQRLQQLKWPFSTGETKELLQDLQRHKSTISLALSVDSLRKLQLSLAKQEEDSQTLSSIANTVQKIEIHTQITISDLKEKVLGSFMKVNPQPNLETSIKLRYPMTGLWLTGSPRFTTWLETPGSKLWLSGIPGAGKTVLAGAVIQDAITRSYSYPEVGVGFFFCDYKNSNTWNILNILGALISQLSKQNDDAYSRLQGYYDELHPAGRLEKSLDSDELRAKITEMSEHFKQIIVIVDGLDECGDSTDDVVETLHELADYTPNMSISLLSRHERNIQERLQEDFDHIPIAANSEDVRLYVGAEMEKRVQNRQLRITSIELKDEIMNKLVEGAKGMFRWVSCQLDYLCDCVNDADRRKALTELPPDLPKTYHRLLERVNKYPVKVQSLVQMCLQFIAFAIPSLTIPQLQQAVSAPETPNVLLDKSILISEEEIARRCSSLIRKSEDGKRFEFSHFSVQEFLTDTNLLNSPALEKYYLSKSNGETVLAIHCLRFLQLKNFERRPEPSENEVLHISQRNLENPFYEYAAVLWPKFARSHFENPVLSNIANSLFRRPKSLSFLAWSVEFLRHIHDISGDEYGDEMLKFPCSPDRNAKKLEIYVRNVTDDNFSPIHLAAALYIPEICMPLLDNKLEINKISAWGSPLEHVTAGLASFCETNEELKFINYVHYSWYEDLVFWSDTALEDKLKTIELLVGAGAALNNSSSHPGLNLLDLSFQNAAVLLNLSTSTKLMTLGVEPGPTSSNSFRKCMSAWDEEFDVMEHNPNMDKSLLEFLSHLISIPIYTTDTGQKLASTALLAASRFSISLVENPGLVHLNPACAGDVLRAKAMMAVVYDDADTLQSYLVKEKLDVSEEIYPDLDRPYYCCSLLHVAVKEESAFACEILLEFGCHLNVPDSDGNLPVHQCSEHTNCETLDLLLKMGAFHLATDLNGENLWHKCVRSYQYPNPNLIRLLELDQNQTTEAMLARTISGKTPLLTALECGKSINNIARVLLIIDHCTEKPEFWKAHGPIFAAAAEFGSETVVERLVQAGAELDPIGSDKFTPLHQVNFQTTPECAQILNNLYPDAHKLRFQGQTPLECFIEKRLKWGSMPEKELLAILATPDSLSSQNADGETVWSFFCKEILNRSVSWDERDGIYSHFDCVILALLHLGAMTSYEETKRQSGILPLFIALGIEWEQNGLYTTVLSRETLSAVISASRYWEDAKNSSEAVAFLKEAIEDGNLEVVKLILEHGVIFHPCVN